MRCKRGKATGDTQTYRAADMEPPVARPEHWGGELSEDPILCSQLPQVVKLSKASGALKSRCGSGLADNGGSKRRRSVGRPAASPLADLTNFVAPAIALPAARPKHWTGELTEDPILCSQAVAGGWFDVARDDVCEKISGGGSTSSISSGGKKRRSTSKAEASAQPSERGRQPATPATARVGANKFRAPASQIAMLSLDWYFRPARTLGTVDCNAGAKATARADSSAEKQVLIAASFTAPRNMDSPLTPLGDLERCAVGAPVNVEAVVATVGELVVEELGMQPGEFVKRRALTLEQDSVSCRWLLWAGDAQRCGSDLAGKRILIRRTKVCCDREGRHHLVGCPGGVEFCGRAP